MTIVTSDGTDVNTPLIDPQEIQRALNILFQPGQVIELRALEAKTTRDNWRPFTASGYYNSIDALIADAKTITEATNIYITLQEIDRSLLARAINRLRTFEEMKKGPTTADEHVKRFRWLLIDADVTRPAGISATNGEHDAALRKVQYIRETLRGESWPEPISGDSGNGGHLLYKIDLPTEDKSIVEQTLKGLATRFDDEQVHIDQTVFNPARICKLYGTRAGKGDDLIGIDGVEDRPHRLSKILAVPDTLIPVSRDLLEALAPAPAAPPTSTKKLFGSQTQKRDWDMEDFISKYSVATLDKASYNGGYKWHLVECPFCHSTDRGACLYQRAGGELCFKCSHNRCAGKDWKDYRLLYEPDAYTQKSEAQTSGNDTSSAEKQESALTRLMKIADNAKYICTPSGALYARVPVNSHHQIVSINEHGSGFRRWLVFTYKSLYGMAPNSEAISLAMSGIVADAEYTGEKAKVHTRIAEHNGCLYLDLANDKWQCVEISPDGYRVITCPPVYFRRPNGMLPLPVPKAGGSLDDLRNIINAKEEKDYILLLSWLVGSLHPTGPYAVLSLNGERGSAKTKTTAILRKIIDPNEALTRSTPKDLRETAIMAQNNMIVALDNISSIPLWFSDALCRISTGSGYTTRALYSDDDEIVFSTKRPIILNGIEDGLVSQGDLMNRTIVVTLKPPDVYQTEEAIDALFDEKHPQILGALLSIASHSLRNRKKVQIDKLPRLADFAKWVTAAEPELHWQAGTFMSVFAENQENATSIVLEGSPLAKALTQFMDKRNREEWSGYTSDLFDELNRYSVFSEWKKGPKNARALSGQIKRIASSLRVQGIDIQQLPRDRIGSKIIITSSCVANDVPDVANDVANKAKNNFATSNQAVSEGDSASKTVSDVANVAKNPHLSTLYPPLENEEKSEKESTPDKVGNFATSPTFATSLFDHTKTFEQSNGKTIDEQIAAILAQLKPGKFVVVAGPDGAGLVKSVGNDSVDLDHYGKVKKYTGAAILGITP